MIIILVDYLIPIQSSNSDEVPWLVLPEAWQLNHCPEIIATIPRETLSSAFNLSRAGCVRMLAIDLIPEDPVIVPLPIVHWVTGIVKHLPHI